MSEEIIEQPTNYQPVIWTAAESGDIDSVKYTLFKYPQCVNKPDLIKQTPLHWAARSGRYEMCKLLIEKGADVNAKSNDGSTPLHWAAIKGQPRICKLLLDNGADVNATETDGETPLHFAAYCSNLETVKILVHAGANIEAKQDDGSTPITMATNDDVMDYLLKKKDKQKVKQI